LHVFNTGFNRMSPLLAPPPRPWRPVPAFAIVHPRAGVLAFDTGLSDATARRGEAAMAWPARWLLESRGDPRRRFDVQLREAGLAPPRTIVHSHLHEDHTGTSALFSKATVLSAHPFDRPGPRPFERNFDLFGDGCVRLIPGGGHTHEDVMALLALPQGPVLLAGDAVVHFDWLGAQDVERIAVDPERAATVRNQVRAFAGVIFPGHDLRRAPRDRADIVLHHPEWFERGAWKP
jgi:glyoxylase-like metal-dependent hydrolase (beta-lactamase superfamily II)